MNKILVFGTGADLNNIDFSRISKEFITAGVNKIYLKFIPDHYYIYDMNYVMPEVPDEIKTVYTHPDKFYEYLYIQRNYKQNFHTYYDKYYTPEFTLHGKRYDCGHASINYLLRMLNNYIYKGQENIFYLVGVPLLEDIGHFYDDVGTTSTQRHLDRFFSDFLRLKELKYNIISLMETSKLNGVFPQENVNIIYGDIK